VRALPLLVSLIAVVAGLGASAVHPLLGVGAVVALVVAAITFSQPFHATLAFLVVLVTRPTDMVPALEVLKPGKVLAVSALGLWLLGAMFHGRLTRSSAPHGRFMAWLTVATLLSALAGSDRAAGTALFTDVFVKIVILYLLVVQLVDRAERVVTMHVVMSLATSGLAAYALHAKLTGTATIEGSRAGFVGLLGDPNDLALVLLMYVPYLIEATLASRGALRWALALQLLLLLSGLASTQSRGGLLGLGLALALTFQDRGTLKLKLMLAPAVLVALLGVALAAGVGDRQSGGMDGDGIDESAQGRLDAWIAGGRMLRRHPVLGVGFGRFADNFEGYASNAVIWGKHETHNSYIKVAAETGLMGLIPFLGLVVTTLRTGVGLRELTRSDRGLARAARLSLLPSAAGFCLTAFFLSQSWSWFFYILFATSAASHGVFAAPATQVRA